MEEISLAAELGLLERFAASQIPNHPSFLISVFDRSGHEFSGTLKQLSREHGMLVLAGNKDQLSFVKLSEIVHFTLHDASLHTPVLRNQQSNSAALQAQNIQVLDQLELLMDRLKTNYELSLSITLAESCDSFVRSEPLAEFIATFENHLVELAKDDFANAELKTISDAIIEHQQGDRLRFKRDGSSLVISLDLSMPLGFKLASQIEAGLNKIL